MIWNVRPSREKCKSRNGRPGQERANHAIFQSIQNVLEMSNLFPFANNRIVHSLTNEYEGTFGKQTFRPFFSLFLWTITAATIFCLIVMSSTNFLGQSEFEWEDDCGKLRSVC
jgi:hypothetical protein